MKTTTIALLSVFTLLMILHHPLAAADEGGKRGPRFKTEAQSTATAPEKMNKWAIMVGINHYEDPDMGHLRYAVSDVQMVYNILVDASRGGIAKDRVTLLTDNSEKKPTRANILRSLKELLNKEGSTILFYYAGHGIELDGQSYLMPRDVQADFPEDRGIPLSIIKDMLSKSRVKSKVVILDACHSGGSATIRRAVRMGEDYQNFLTTQSPNMVILAAASQNQLANENPEEGHGIFSLALSAGLAGEGDTNRDGLVTTEELFPYVRDWVKKWVKTHAEEPQDAFTSGYISEKIVLALTPAVAQITVEDTQPPQILLTEPLESAEATALEVEVEGHEVRISGFVHDNVDVSQVSIDNEMISLIAPNPPVEAQRKSRSLGKKGIPAGAQAFSRVISLPKDTSVRTVVIRAFDTSGNVRRLDITFRVPLSPEFIPETVYVPAGKFLMGSNAGRDDEKPQRTVELSAYEIGKYEVTNAQFAAFVNQTGYITTAEREMGSYMSRIGDFVDGASWIHPYGPGSGIERKDDHPVVHISFYDAIEYCKWLSGRMGRFSRLPTEAEWERAGRGENGRKYPWGNEIDPGKANYRRGPGQTTPVHSESSKSKIGCYHMAGNVREWCADWYTMKPEVAEKDPTGPQEETGYKVVKGGSFLSDANLLRAPVRMDVEPEQTADDLGFRVAVSP